MIDAILTTKGIQRAHAIAKQTEKRLERGGFEKRIELLWVEDKMSWKNIDVLEMLFIAMIVSVMMTSVRGKGITFKLLTQRVYVNF